MVSIACSDAAGAWGLEGHRTINFHGIRSLPLSLQRFREIDYYFADHASDVDRRKLMDEEESYRQFIELERYPEFFNRTMPRSLLELQKKYSKSSVRQNGYLPYLIYEMYDSVVQTMKRRDWEATLKAVTDLGHYVGDLTMPFNTTMNYDGQLTKNNGIKWRYEIELMNRYYNQLHLRRIEAKKLDNPMNDIFALLLKSFLQVPVLLKADASALRSAKGNYNSTYYSAFWKGAEPATNDVMQAGVALYANLVYTAWIKAGGTKIVWPDETEQSSSTLYFHREYESLEPNFPNPFNPRTTIKYRLKDEANVILSVFNLFGQEIQRLHEGRQGAGKYEFIFSGDQLPGGVYFIRLQVNEKTETRKMILSK
ncbi:MAG: T9SS type A sorting domain-containing protein [Bacteroidota bacterium]